MGRTNSSLKRTVMSVTVLLALGVLVGFTQNAEAITASIGQPYNGRLVNGIPFPRQFPGYQLRDEDRTYTTPEVVGALLDAIEAVRTQFPGTCDLYIGDFSAPRGGAAIHHRSHQNGRDVDLGMYVKGNRRMDSLLTMNEDNLDVAKTWCLIENLIRSQRVQYIFLDRRVQKPLYEYAASRGADPKYLDLLFGNLKGSIIQHLRNHQDHIHVRFFAPWSTLAGHVGEGEDRKRMVIEMAQQAYLPKKVQYYVNGSEKGLDALASSFGVTSKDLCRWNQLPQNGVLVPGSCLVFYKRGFEFESVSLARTLQPGFIAEAAPVQVASYQPADTVSDAPEPVRPLASSPVVRRSEPRQAPTTTAYRVKRGETVEQVARRSGMDVQALRQMNNLKKNAPLKTGQMLRVSFARQAPAQEPVRDRSSSKSTASAPLQTCDPKDYRKSTPAPAPTHTVGKGDTLDRIARKYGTDADTLAHLNGLKKNASLKPGQNLQVKEAPKAQAKAVPAANDSASSKSRPGKVSAVSGPSRGCPVTTPAASVKPSQAQAPKANVKASPAPAPKANVKASPAPAPKANAKASPAQAPKAQSQKAPAGKAPVSTAPVNSRDAQKVGKGNAADKKVAAQSSEKRTAPAKVAQNPKSGSKKSVN